MINPILPEPERKMLELQGQWLAAKMMRQQFVQLGFHLEIEVTRMWYVKQMDALIYQFHAIEDEILALAPQLRRN